MREELRELWRYRELLISLVEREIRIRYKNSILGFLWSLLNPLLTVLVMTFVFKFVMKLSVSSYVLYVLAAYLPYIFFQMALLDSAQSVLSSLPMVRKVYFPREVLPLAQILANFIHFLLALVVFFLISFAVWLPKRGDFPIQPTVLLLPILLLIHLALVMGLGLIISALNTFYEDVKYIASAALYILLFLTPVMYFLEAVADAFSHHGKLGQIAYFVYQLNPMATLCTAYRKVLLAPVPIPVAGKELAPMPMDWAMLGLTAVFSFGILYLGYAMFNRLKWGFVERP